MTGVPWHDPIGPALAHATEKQRARVAVSNANDGRQATSPQKIVALARELLIKL
jgi:hypothetical protein